MWQNCNRLWWISEADWGRNEEWEALRCSRLSLGFLGHCEENKTLQLLILWLSTSPPHFSLVSPWLEEICWFMEDFSLISPSLVLIRSRGCLLGGGSRFLARDYENPIWIRHATQRLPINDDIRRIENYQSRKKHSAGARRDFVPKMKTAAHYHNVAARSQMIPQWIPGSKAKDELFPAL